MRLLKAAGALVVLALLLIGFPVLLVVTVGNPWPAGGYAALELMSDEALMGVAAAVGWAFWAQMVACVLAEIPAAISGAQAPRVPLAFGGQQRVARVLVNAVLAVGIGAAATATPMVAQAAPAAPTPTTHAAAQAPSSSLASSSTPQQSPVDEQRAGGHASERQQRQAATDDDGAAREVVVNPGDSWWRLAATHLEKGDRWREIYEANEGRTMTDGHRLTSPDDVLQPGWKVEIPSGGGTHLEQPGDQTDPAGKVVTVQAGDTLSAIALSEYGDASRYPEIATATARISQPDGSQLTDPDHIEVGWKVIVPTKNPIADPEFPHAPPGDESGDQPGDRSGEGEGSSHASPEREAVPPAAPASPGDPADQVPEEPETQPETQPETSAPEVTAEPSQSAPAEPDVQADNASAAEQADEMASESGGHAPWMLAGLTAGGGVLLSGALFLGLRARRRAQFRARSLGRTIAVPPPDLAPVEMTINAVGGPAAATVEATDLALKRLAAAVAADGGQMPPLAAVELAANTITLHLSGPADLPAPWQGTEDRMHWHTTTEDGLDADAGAKAEDQAAEAADVADAAGAVEPPYPLLVTIGEGDAGEKWLLNCEELSPLTVDGDPDRGRDFARHLAAQLAVNPWSETAQVDCIGVAAEVDGMDPRVRHHSTGAEDADLVTADVLADAVRMVDRTGRHGTDTSTGRAGAVGDDTWPARMLMVDAGNTPPADLDELLGLVAGHVGRTATSIIITGGEHRTGEIPGSRMRVTSTGRLVLDQAGLDLTAVSLTADEARGCAAVYAAGENLAAVEIPFDETAVDGWGKYADAAGALRREHTVSRSTPVADLEEPLTSILDGDDEDYLREAAAVAEDLEALAPRVPARVRLEVEEADPDLDRDVADWFDQDGPRPRLTLLGPISARTHGKALPKRKAYYTELLAFLALRRHHGVTPAEVADAFGVEARKARGYVNVVRDWLGVNPATSELHLPHADKAPAAKVRGVNVYQVDDGLLVDVDLFKRLRVRGEARGGAEGLADLVTALELVAGRPFDQLREGGWSWLLEEGERFDHYMTSAIADVAFLVTTAALTDKNLTRARAAAEIAVFAAPYEEATRLCLVKVTDAEGDRREAERILRDEVCNRSDDGDAPADLSERTQAIIRSHEWLAG